MSDLSFSVDVLAVYAQVQQPNKETGTFSIDMIPVNAEEEAKLTKLGLQPARNQEGKLISHEEKFGLKGTVYRAKRKTVSKDGKALTPPLITDGNNNPTKVLIGNGSKVRVIGNVYAYKMAGKSGIAAGFNQIQILDLVPFKMQAPPVKGSFDASSETVETTHVDFNNNESIL